MVDLVMLILLLKNGRPSHVNLTPNHKINRETKANKTFYSLRLQLCLAVAERRIVHLPPWSRYKV